MLAAVAILITKKILAVWMVSAILIDNIRLVDPNALFGLLGSLVIVALAGLFTLRTSLGKYWKDAYEEQRMRAESAEREAEEQREAKHTLKTELAAQKMKSDVTPILREMAELHRFFMERETTFALVLKDVNDSRAETTKVMNDRFDRMESAIVAGLANSTVAVNKLTEMLERNGI
jgi:hypothetical protein